MKRVLISSLLLCGLAFAKKASTDPADYPLTGHVVAIDRTFEPGRGTSTYNYQTNAWSYGTINGSSDATVQFRIDNLLYTAGYGCRKVVTVGGDVHIQKDGNKLRILTNDGKTCSSKIRGIKEVK